MPTLTKTDKQPLLGRSEIQRLADWETRLVHWLQQAADTPFQWGEFDCALAAADALTVQTGHDFARFWRGQYTTGQGGTQTPVTLWLSGCL